MKSITFVLPYTPAASKNRKFAFYSRKKLSDDYVSFREAVCACANIQSSKFGISYKPHKKVRVDVVLYKTRKMTRTDAQNFLEVICDGVKDSIKVDDCWFSGSFDWTYTENDPQIQVKVSQ